MRKSTRQRHNYYLLAAIFIALLGMLAWWKLNCRTAASNLTGKAPPAPTAQAEVFQGEKPPAPTPNGHDSHTRPQQQLSRGQGDSAAAPQRHSDFQLLSATPTETRFAFVLAEHQTAIINRADGQYAQILADSACFNQVRGTPALPIYQADLLLPDDLEATLEVISTDFTDYPTLPVTPAAGLALRNQPLTTALPDPAVYSSAQPFPATAATLTTPYRLRRTRGATVLVAPIQYLPQQGILRVHHRLELALRADAAQVESYPSADPEWNFSALQRRHFLNASLLRSSSGSSPGSILFIRPDSWANATSAFLTWKSSIGFSIEEASYPGDTGVSPSALRSYLLQAYQERGLTHVIIGGDYLDVPPWQISSQPGSPGTLPPTSDTYYSLLDGDDLVPDVFLSRVPAADATQLGNVLSKFIDYEATPPAEDSWRQQAIFLASEDYAFNSELGQERDSVLMGRVRDSLVQTGVYPGDACVFLARANATATNLRNAFNGGAAVMLYLGHGTSTALTTTGFDTAQAVALTNNSWLPFILSPVCDNGNFAYPGGDSLAEAFLHASDGQGSRHGAIAILAASSNTYWDPPIASIYQFRDDLINAHSSSRLTQLGAYSQSAVLAGYAYATAATYWQAPGTVRQDNTAEYYAAQMHLFGDCAAAARLRPLRQLLVNATLIENEALLSISLAWDDDTPVPGAQLAFSTPTGELLHAGLSDADGAFNWHHQYLHQQVTLTVFDPSTRLHVENIDLEPPTITYDLKAIFTGIDYLLKLLPDNCAAGTISDIDGLPPGMSLSPDGFLQGTPITVGNYFITFSAKTPQNAPCQINANLCVLTQPDKDLNGLISNQELLAFLQEWQEWQADEDTKIELIERWVQEGAHQQQSRQEIANDQEKLPDAADGAFHAGEIQPLPTRRLVIARPAADAFARLASTGANIVAATDTTLILHGSQQTLEELSRQGFTVISWEEIDNSPTRSNPLYPSPAEVNEQILALARQYSQLCRPTYIGASVEGREILGLRVNADLRRDNLPQLLIIGAIHGDERPAAVMALRLAQYLLETAEADNENTPRVLDILARSEIFLVPTINPDGMARVSRYNANGYDLNRNFPDGVILPQLGTFADASSLRLASRQPETQALIRWCSAHNFSASLNLHMGATLVCYPYGNNPRGVQVDTPTPDDSLLKYLALTYAQANQHMRFVDWPMNGIINSAAWYPVTGEFSDWQYRFLGIQALTVELYRYAIAEGASNVEGKESTHPEHLNSLWHANRNSLLRWLEVAGSGIGITVLDQDSQSPIPGARLVVSTGQPVATSAVGYCHRPLLPGPLEVSVIASGYQASPSLPLSLSAGELFSETIHLSRTSPLRAADFPQRHRFLPLRRNLLSWQVTAAEFFPAGAMLSMQLPAGWQPPSLGDTSASALRVGANNTFTLLMLPEETSGRLPEHLQAWLTPPDAATNDHVLTSVMEWLGDQHETSRHWLGAEARPESLFLTNGWNFTGTATCATPAALANSGLAIWQWQDRSWQLTSTEAWQPGTAAWVYSETAQTLPLNGWMPHEDLHPKKIGLQPIFSIWPQTTSTWPAFRFNQQQKTYEQTFTLEREAAWVWQTETAP